MKPPALPAALAAAILSAVPASAAPSVHAVVDLAHEFTFYGDGRFHRQYLHDQAGATSWGALYNFDLSNANLLVLLGCDEHLAYVPRDIETIRAFLRDGGGVLLLGAAGAKPQNELARHFGCEFGGRMSGQPKALDPAITGAIAGGGDTLRLGDAEVWEVLVADAGGAPLLARRRFGKGTLVAGARGLAGSNPDASDNINAAWWRPLLVRTAAGKAIDPGRPPKSRGLAESDNREQAGNLTLHYSDYLKPHASEMLAIYQRCQPVIEKRMGVPLSEGMASEVGLLATGGGGFSSGRMIGLAVFWGGFPERQDSMIEFITHETTHSWVLPFPEIWNEPIATYVGNLVMADMGYPEEGERRIRETIARATRIDPTLRAYDIDGTSRSGAPKLDGGKANDMHWGKTFWIFEELRRQQPDILARYFQAKRRLAKPGALATYDANATVAVLSAAANRDLFPWFREIGFDVDPARSPIPAPGA